MTADERSDMTPTDFDWAVRAEIYRVFGERGSAPPVGELAAAVGSTEHQIRTALQRLFAAHEIAPRANGDGVWMANPFSAVPTGYPVETPHMSCWANCAWDALGVPAILETDGWIRTRCAQSGEPMELGVRDGRLEGDDGVIHLVTPLRDAWADIGFT
jgi:hypothetical protein